MDTAKAQESNDRLPDDGQCEGSVHVLPANSEGGSSRVLYLSEEKPSRAPPWCWLTRMSGTGPSKRSKTL